MSKKNRYINRGAAILTLIFVALFFILLGRFLYIQINGKVDGKVLATIADEKWVKQKTLQATRGTIYDRNGKPVAEDTPSYTVYAILDETYPTHVKDIRKTAEKLSPILDISVDKLVKTMSQEKPFQVEFGPNGRNINHSLKEKIEKLNLPGIGFQRDTNRFYPNGEFASHIIGFASATEDGLMEGQMGIEKSYDKLLRGSDGSLQFRSDRKGYKLPDPDEVLKKPQNGKDVYLTIDQKIQTFLEDALNQAVQEYEPEKIIAIVANPKTGEILAMGNRPSFNPNLRDIENYNNDAISYRFEPGSTMKIFTLSAAVEEGVFNPNDTYQSGSYAVGSDRIRDHNRSGWGTITYLEGVQRSSNVAFAKLANEKLGTERLLQYIGKFGLTKKTGIDLPGEVNSKILYNYPLEKVTTAFGQGSTITPIQQIQGATAIANEGKMMKPYIIKKIVDPNTDKVVKQTEPEVVGEPISANTAKEVLDILETVVTSDHGTGKPYAIEGYSVAGKTGTAQIPKDVGKGYLSGHGNYIYSFIGMAPKDDPHLLIYVAVKKPKLEPFELGSDPGALIFKTVMKNSLQYLNIEPNEEQKEKQPAKTDLGKVLPETKGESPEKMTNQLKAMGLEVQIIGSGSTIKNQIPAAGTRVLSGEKVLLYTGGTAKMPDLKNWSVRDVLKLTELLKLKQHLIGSGFAFKQSISPGTEVRERDYLITEFKPPNEDPPEKEKQEDAEQTKDEKKVLD